jgi:hypothetical protein
MSLLKFFLGPGIFMYLGALIKKSKSKYQKTNNLQMTKENSKPFSNGK